MRGAFFLILFIFVATSTNRCFAQESEVLQKALEKAIRNVEKEKLIEQERLIAKLRLRLNLASQRWLAQSSNNKKRELNRLIQQNWETLPGFLSASHYEYYLRDYDYSVTGSDIVKTESLIDTPYRAYINLRERLFVERDHPVNVPYRSDYFYTVNRDITVSLEYRRGKFIAADTEEKASWMEKGWPKNLAESLL